MQEKIKNTRGFYACTGTGLNGDCIQLIKKTLQGGIVLAYVYKGQRRGLVVNVKYFPSFHYMKALITFINEYCEIKFDKPPKDVYDVWEHLEEEYGIINHNIDFKYRKGLRTRRVQQKELEGLF